MNALKYIVRFIGFVAGNDKIVNKIPAITSLEIM